jgi:hypothetical protein
VSSAALRSRAPATTETATMSTPTHSLGSRQPGVAARVAGGVGAEVDAPRSVTTGP